VQRQRFFFACFSLLFLLTVPFAAQAQQENNIWYFGRNAGIDFNGPTPVSISDGRTNVEEGVATICDGKTGSLLFYTDGTTVWDRNHTVMPNGAGLIGGNGTATQAALIIPFPSDSNKYFLFTADSADYNFGRPNRGVFYSIIDMRANGGFGDVLVKNQLLFTPSTTEKLTAIPHSNGCDVWIIGHRQNTNEYETALLSDSVLSGTHVISTGNIASNIPGGPTGSIGYLVPSRKGDRLAYLDALGNLEIVNFDRTTGMVSNPKNLTFVGTYTYGICFSPSGERLYISRYAPNQVLQFDLTKQSDAEIAQSQVIVGEFNAFPGAIRPGPDGKLYVALRGRYIGVINNPDSLGAACNFVERGLTLTSGQCLSGLPNIIDPYLNQTMRPCIEPLSVQSDRQPVCVNSCTQLSVAGHHGKTLYWKIGDSIISNDLSITVCPNQTGIELVKLYSVDEPNDTTIVEYPLTVIPSNTIVIDTAAVMIDTIGGPVDIPITLSKKATLSNVTYRMIYDSSAFEYLGSVDLQNNPIDVEEVSNNGVARLSIHEVNDSIIGFARFNLYWSGNVCSTLHFDSLQFSSSECLVAEPSEKSVCFRDECGVKTLSEFMRGRPLSLSVTVNKYGISISSTVSLPNATIRLVNSLGSTLMERIVTVGPENKVLLDIQNIPSGLYTVIAEVPQLGVYSQHIVLAK